MPCHFWHVVLSFIHFNDLSLLLLRLSLWPTSCLEVHCWTPEDFLLTSYCWFLAWSQNTLFLLRFTQAGWGLSYCPGLIRLAYELWVWEKHCNPLLLLGRVFCTCDYTLLVIGSSVLCVLADFVWVFSSLSCWERNSLLLLLVLSFAVHISHICVVHTNLRVQFLLGGLILILLNTYCFLSLTVFFVWHYFFED